MPNPTFDHLQHLLLTDLLIHTQMGDITVCWHGALRQAEARIALWGSEPTHLSLVQSAGWADDRGADWGGGEKVEEGADKVDELRAIVMDVSELVKSSQNGEL